MEFRTFEAFEASSAVRAFKSVCNVGRLFQGVQSSGGLRTQGTKWVWASRFGPRA